MLDYIGYDRQQWRAECQLLGFPSYKGDVIFKWIHKFGVLDFNLMTDLSKSQRELLQQKYRLTAPAFLQVQSSTDGTAKNLFSVTPNVDNCIESVVIPEPNRTTLCVSSQAGCALRCSFCATGLQGWSADLTAGEIVGQLWHSVHVDKVRVTNVVFMGMGEPLLNTQAVSQAARIMLDDSGYGLSKHRVTISTSGVLPAIQSELDPGLGTSLALSLHAVDTDLRNILVPLNKKYPYQDVLKACDEYIRKSGTKRKLFVEWILLAGINDSISQAKDLAKALHGISAKINLMPYNRVAGLNYDKPDKEQCLAFYRTLSNKGIPVTLRRDRGADVNAACGQLSGKVVVKKKAQVNNNKLIVDSAQSIEAFNVVD